jgi:DNA primase
MGLIPAETIEAIRSRLDIGELVAEYVTPLQRAGRNLKGCCPFHQERTPSFIVSPERQTFHCFGCGEGGDAFTFLMKIEHLSFMEAAEKLAGKAGVKLEATEEAFGPEAKERLRLKELLEFAAGHYHEVLLKSPAAEAARKYFAGRKVTAKSVEDFRLGYAPGGGSLLEAAAKKGFAGELLVRVGLAAAQKTTGKLRDYFYDRVLFPIRDAKGAVVGFGGRIMGDGEPKYLNSPDSPAFAKGRVLYGLFEGLAAVRKARKAVLMEGYMDVIAAHQHGLVQACAPLGTALTQDHASLLKRYCTEVAVVFDADSAGLNAAVRGAEVGLAAGLGVRIATVPSGKDPDEFLHAKGLEAFKTDCLMKSKDLVEFKTDLLISKESQPLSPQAKSSVAKAVLASIEQCPDEILKAEWTRKLAERLGVAQEALLRQMDKDAAAPARRRHQEAPAPVYEKAELPEDDQHLLMWVLKKPGLAALIKEDELASDTARRIWKTLKGMSTSDGAWSARLLEALPEADRKATTGLLVDDKKEDDPEQKLMSVLNRRRAWTRLREIEPLVREMGDGRRAKDPAMQQEYAKLLTQTKKHQTR